MLYLVGLGLGDEKDISIKGLEIIRRCQTVYLEIYTSLLGVDKAKLVSKGFLLWKSNTMYTRKLFMNVQSP